MLDIYVDGSYIREVSDKAGWAFVVLENGREIYKQNGLTAGVAESWNIDGELEATIKALEWAAGRACKIYHDYEGIEKWAKGLWKAKKPVSKRYRMYMHNVDMTKVQFVKVKSHSGDKWNDRVDELAGLALAAG